MNFKGFSRLLNKTYDSELSFVSRQTMHQSHLRKSAPCSSRNIFNGGVSLTPLKPEKQNENLEVLTADDFNCGQLAVDEDKCHERHKLHC